MGIVKGLLHRVRTAPPLVDGTAQRVLEAALRQAEDFGVRRFTVDDVARRCGLSRVTIYRYFPKKDALLDALLMSEMRSFLTKADAVVAAQATPEARLVEGLLFCLDFLRSHRLLNRLLRTEPEFILPHLTTRAEPAIAEARAWISDQVRAEVAAGRLTVPDRDIDTFAELVVRLVISFTLTPETAIPLDDPAARRRLVDLYLAPFVRHYTPPRT
ncbi:TetR family transcriptional regulator [Actinocorallia herbida]|uniref:TetR family transcriptional regulator n=1 Tax=Actinocorallia herbida TaxID=58109 RepID=A0A3N1CXK4_9ACTN|nr:TetR/AcrR family transcriptional regulator [Actinocorallia herbida]ROO86001.1 TetR family transcriptional regulator [Actinocorallia herbida]